MCGRHADVVELAGPQQDEALPVHEPRRVQVTRAVVLERAVEPGPAPQVLRPLRRQQARRAVERHLHDPLVLAVEKLLQRAQRAKGTRASRSRSTSRSNCAETSRSVFRSTARRVRSAPRARAGAKREQCHQRDRGKEPRPEGHDRMALYPEPRTVRIGGRPAELATELRDVDVDRARAARVAHPPDPVEQLVARDHDAGVLDQVGEQVELLAGQLDRRAGDRHLARLRIERDVAELEHLGARRGAGAPQDGLDAGGELARREGLRNVVVGADLEPGDAIGLLVARRQHHDRDVRSGPGCCGRRRTRPPGRPMSRITSRGCTVERLEGVLAGAHPGDAVAGLLEVGADERADRLLVLDEQELRPRRARGAGAPPRPPRSSATARTSFAGRRRPGSRSRPYRGAVQRRSAAPLIVIVAVAAIGIDTIVRPARAASASRPPCCGWRRDRSGSRGGRRRP